MTCAERDQLQADNENLTQFCRDAQALALEVVWGGKPGQATTPEIDYIAGIGGIRQAFDILKAERDQLAAEVEQQKHSYETQRVAIELLKDKLGEKSRGTDGFGSTGVGSQLAEQAALIGKLREEIGKMRSGRSRGINL